MKPVWRWSEGRTWSGAAGLLCAAAAGLLSRTPFLERWELRTQDYRFEIRGPRTTHARILIAPISDTTLAAWEEPMASWGAHYAAAITQAREAGASWIGLDFIQAVSGGDESDQRLALALHGGRVVLSQMRSSGGAPVSPIPALVFARPEQPSDIGFVDVRPELDSVVRHAAVWENDGVRLAASFPAILALRLRRQSPSDEAALRSLAGSAPQRSRAGTVWINYIGPPGSFPYLPIERLEAGNLSSLERGQLRDAVVLIGPTYSGANDQHRGPGGSYYHGVEINAHVLATLLDNRPLRRAGREEEALITAAAGIFVALAISFLSIGWGLALTAAVGAAWWWGALHAFAADELWPTAGPLLATGLTWTGHHVARSVEEAHRRRRIQGLFGRYVTSDVVEFLLRHPAHLRLGGEESDVSMLFVDIRGHTTAAQGRKPSEVMDELNQLFGQIAPVVQRCGGLLYGYRGDGFLAVFGAPRPLENHAQAAVDAAVEIVRITRRVSAERLSTASHGPRGNAGMRVGCGVNSGRVVCGNLGASDRTEYTVIGDNVNLAARLQDLNKAPELNTEFASEVVISEATYRSLSHPPPARGPFEFVIRGREGQTRVYQVEIGDV